MLDPWLSDASSEDEIAIRKRQRCALTPVERLAARKRRRRTARIDKPLGGRVALQSYWSSCLPGVLLPLLELVFDTLIPNKYDAVEYFSGNSAVTRGISNRGFSAIGFDKAYHRGMDLTSDYGFLFALCLALSATHADDFLAPLYWSGIVCGSWIWVCRSTSMRTKWRPHGDTRLKFVRKGNMMVARQMLLFLVGSLRGGIVILEQPGNSIMPAHPLFKATARFLKLRRTHTWMACFGGDSPKSTQLWSNASWASQLTRKGSREIFELQCGAQMTTKVWDPDKQKYITTGGPDLHESQEYPEEFGKEVAKLFQLHRGEQCRVRASKCSVDAMIAANNWAEADIAGIVQRCRG